MPKLVNVNGIFNLLFKRIFVFVSGCVVTYLVTVELRGSKVPR